MLILKFRSETLSTSWLVCRLILVCFASTDLAILGLTASVGLGTTVRACASESQKDALDTASFEYQEGRFPFFWDPAEGKVYLEITGLDEPFLYVSSLASGLGSNPVGLDRGQLGDSRIVFWKRVGSKVFLIQENTKFRASSPSVAEQRAVRDSFAESVLWSGKVVENQEGKTLVDLSPFLLRDAHDCIAALSSSGQGSFSLDSDRSFLFHERIRGFPKNSEFEAVLTFESSRPGALARQAAADGSSITMRQHHSFIELPDDDYQPRKFDPRSGCFSMVFADYSAAIDQPLEQRFITRHRLKKRQTGDAPSAPVQPIVYYLDPGVPEPVRQALLDGARWWSEAFEAAGFLNAYQLRMLPDDADPLDVRYNVIQWVHRATRGWSYGQSIVDPRTGEIIKGHVLLGSLRVRQDRLLIDALVGNAAAQDHAAACGIACSCGMQASVSNDMVLAQLAPGISSTEVALARIRQLSAHEVGHTLGFAHNFAASTYANRGSVMDYPAPRVKVRDGQLDLSDAYGVGIGAWDKFIVQYAYSEFPAGEQSEKLQQLIAEAIDQGMLYVTDGEARPSGAAHPLGNLWDDGEEPVSGLEHSLQVRELALAKFDSSVVPEGEPLSDLEKSFVPLYLHHRYQVDAAAKLLGGYETTYAVRGDQQVPLSPVPVDRQRAALKSLLRTLQPKVLVIDEAILRQMPPGQTSSVSDIERFSSQTKPMFDSVSAMHVASDLTIANLLQPHRAARLAALEDGEWGLSTVIEALIKQAFEELPAEDSKLTTAQRVVQQVLVQRLIELAGNSDAAFEARALASLSLTDLVSHIDEYAERGKDNALVRAHAALLSETIRRFQSRPDPTAQPSSNVEAPPGSPIGTSRR